MVKVCVCIGSACHLHGAHNVVATFQHLIEEKQLHDKIHLEASFCMRRCAKEGVSLTVNGEEYRIEAEKARSFFNETVLPLVQ